MVRRASSLLHPRGFPVLSWPRPCTQGIFFRFLTASQSSIWGTLRGWKGTLGDRKGHLGYNINCTRFIRHYLHIMTLCADIWCACDSIFGTLPHDDAITVNQDLNVSFWQVGWRNVFFGFENLSYITCLNVHSVKYLYKVLIGYMKWFLSYAEGHLFMFLPSSIINSLQSIPPQIGWIFEVNVGKSVSSCEGVHQLVKWRRA